MIKHTAYTIDEENNAIETAKKLTQPGEIDISSLGTTSLLMSDSLEQLRQIENNIYNRITTNTNTLDYAELAKLFEVRSLIKIIIANPLITSKSHEKFAVASWLKIANIDLDRLNKDNVAIRNLYNKLTSGTIATDDIMGLIKTFTKTSISKEIARKIKNQIYLSHVSPYIRELLGYLITNNTITQNIEIESAIINIKTLDILKNLNEISKTLQDAYSSGDRQSIEDNTKELIKNLKKLGISIQPKDEQMLAVFFQNMKQIVSGLPLATLKQEEPTAAPLATAATSPTTATTAAPTTATVASPTAAIAATNAQTVVQAATSTAEQNNPPAPQSIPNEAERIAQITPTLAELDKRLTDALNDADVALVFDNTKLDDARATLTENLQQIQQYADVLSEDEKKSVSHNHKQLNAFLNDWLHKSVNVKKAIIEKIWKIELKQSEGLSENELLKKWQENSGTAIEAMQNESDHMREWLSSNDPWTWALTHENRGLVLKENEYSWGVNDLQTLPEFLTIDNKKFRENTQAVNNDINTYLGKTLTGADAEQMLNKLLPFDTDYKSLFSNDGKLTLKTATNITFNKTQNNNIEANIEITINSIYNEKNQVIATMHNNNAPVQIKATVVFSPNTDAKIHSLKLNVMNLLFDKIPPLSIEKLYLSNLNNIKYLEELIEKTDISHLTHKDSQNASLINDGTFAPKKLIFSLLEKNDFASCRKEIAVLEKIYDMQGKANNIAYQNQPGFAKMHNGLQNIIYLILQNEKTKQFKPSGEQLDTAIAQLNQAYVDNNAETFIAALKTLGITDEKNIDVLKSYLQARSHLTTITNQQDLSKLSIDELINIKNSAQDEIRTILKLCEAFGQNAAALKGSPDLFFADVLHQGFAFYNKIIEAQILTLDRSSEEKNAAQEKNVYTAKLTPASVKTALKPDDIWQENFVSIQNAPVYQQDRGGEFILPSEISNLSDQQLKDFSTRIINKLGEDIAQKYVQFKGEDNLQVGSTFIMSFILPDGRVAVSNIGDSVAFIATKNADTNWVCEQVNELHTMDNPNEKKRISGNGPLVAVTRALGDIEDKEDGLIYTPDTYIKHITANEQAILTLGCDGLYEGEKVKDVATVTSDIAKTLNTKPTASLAQELVQKAIEKGSHDNLTAITAAIKVDGTSATKCLWVADGHGYKPNGHIIAEYVKQNLASYIKNELISREYLYAQLESYLEKGKRAEAEKAALQFNKLYPNPDAEWLDKYPQLRLWIRQTMQGLSTIEKNFRIGTRPFINAEALSNLKNQAQTKQELRPEQLAKLNYNAVIAKLDPILNPKVTVAGTHIKSVLTIWDLIKEAKKISKDGKVAIAIYSLNSPAELFNVKVGNVTALLSQSELNNYIANLKPYLPALGINDLKITLNRLPIYDHNLISILTGKTCSYDELDTFVDKMVNDLKDESTLVDVQCFSGIERSSTVTQACLVKQGYTLIEAAEKLTSIRSVAKGIYRLTPEQQAYLCHIMLTSELAKNNLLKKSAQDIGKNLDIFLTLLRKHPEIIQPKTLAAFESFVGEIKARNIDSSVIAKQLNHANLDQFNNAFRNAPTSKTIVEQSNVIPTGTRDIQIKLAPEQKETQNDAMNDAIKIRGKESPTLAEKLDIQKTISSLENNHNIVVSRKTEDNKNKIESITFISPNVPSKTIVQIANNAFDTNTVTLTGGTDAKRKKIIEESINSIKHALRKNQLDRVSFLNFDAKRHEKHLYHQMQELRQEFNLKLAQKEGVVAINEFNEDSAKNIIKILDSMLHDNAKNKLTGEKLYAIDVLSETLRSKDFAQVFSKNPALSEEAKKLTDAAQTILENHENELQKYAQTKTASRRSFNDLLKSVLPTATAGLATGFFIGGPVGALIGSLGGLAAGLFGKIGQNIQDKKANRENALSKIVDKSGFFKQTQTTQDLHAHDQSTHESKPTLKK